MRNYSSNCIRLIYYCRRYAASIYLLKTLSKINQNVLNWYEKYTPSYYHPVIILVCSEANILHTRINYSNCKMLSKVHRIISSPMCVNGIHTHMVERGRSYQDVTTGYQYQWQTKSTKTNLCFLLLFLSLFSDNLILLGNLASTVVK